MVHLLRLDFERIRQNPERTTDTPQSDEDVLRVLAARGVWRQRADWWGAKAESLRLFAEGEVLEAIG